MHISEGILSPEITIAGFGISAVMTAYCLRKTETDEIPAIAVMGAAFFAASLIHFKVGVTSIHLTLAGITAIVLGNSAPLAILSGIFFQAVMFQHGGITTIGVNAAVMMIPAFFMQKLFRVLTIKKKDKRVIISITAGGLTFCSMLISILLAAYILTFSGEEFRGIALLFTGGNSILALIEAVLSGVVISRLLKIKPEMIYSLR